MTVPIPVFGGSGFVAPSEAAILAAVLDDMNVAFGGDLNPSLATPQGQLASSETAIIGDSYSIFTWMCNQFDPAYATGRMQDALARVYFLTRIAGAPTVVQATCRGLDGVTIPVGALAKAEDGNFYVCQEAGDIVNGKVVLPFACAVNGPIPCDIGALDTIGQAVFGWESIENEDAGSLGRLVETRAEFEERRYASVAINSIGMLSSVLGAVLAVPGVLDAYVTENVTGAAVEVGGFLLAPNSLYVCALGGTDQDVGDAIWSKKAPGCGYNGETTVTVVDPNPAYNPPSPSYEVRFQRPRVIEIAVLVSLTDNAGVPSNVIELVSSAIVAAFAGADGGTRAKIGSTVFASRYYGPVARLGSWAEIITIKVGRNASAATVVGSISGTLLTVTSVSAGVLAVGNLLSGSAVADGTTITSIVFGTGGVGIYRVIPSQTAAAGVIIASSLSDSLQMDIDEAPTTSTALVEVRLS